MLIRREKPGSGPVDKERGRKKRNQAGKIQRSAHRKQMTEDKGLSVSVL